MVNTIKYHRRNKMKKVLLLLIALSLTLCLFACKGEDKCQNHFDTNGDGLCEECNKAADPKEEPKKESLTLIEDGEAKFQIVYPDDISVDMRSNIGDVVNNLKKLGITVDMVSESESTQQECEVLIGDITKRDAKYRYSSYTLGAEGYVVTFIDSKVIINGGSSEALASAILIFANDILGIEDADELDKVVMSSKDCEEEIQNNYSITDITVGGESLRGFKIAADTTLFADEAKAFQNAIYTCSGIWMEIVPLKDAGDKAVIIQSAEKDSTPADSFRIYTEGTKLYVVSEYHNALAAKLDTFTAKNISVKEGVVALSGKLVSDDVSVVRYEDFKAKGDGKTNDFAAIKAAHDYANEGGQKVLGKASATYYISESLINNVAKTIAIKTDVDWQGATIVIDDTNMSPLSSNKKQFETPIFTITQPTKGVEFKGKEVDAFKNGIGPETKKFDLGLGYPAMLVIYNDNHRVYVRYGGNANSGQEQHELVCIDKDGNVEDGTELMLDYDTVTSITAYRRDISQLTIENAVFITKACRFDATQGDKTYGSYFQRGLNISRNNTLVNNITHRIEGEFTPEEEAKQGLDGVCYRGFYSTSNACDVTYTNCKMSARRYFGIHGTYGISASTSNNVVFKDCTQLNYYKADGKTLSMEKSALTGDREYWGLGGSSYCKNLIYDGCKFSRYDAHEGLYNGKITNSQVAMVNLVGGGYMLIENSQLDTSTVFNLRDDYGSTWNGTVEIKNIVLKNNSDKATTPKIVSALWINHDFGYVCAFPNVIIDGITLDGFLGVNYINFYKETKGSDANTETLITWGDKISKEGEKRDKWTPYGTGPDGNPIENKVNVNPYKAPKYIIVKNAKGLEYRFEYSTFFKNTMIRGFAGKTAYNPNETLPK